MLLSALMEIVTINAIIPFLTVLIDPSGKTNNQFINNILNLLGISNIQNNIFSLALLFILTVFIAAIIRIINSKINTKYSSSIGNYLSCKAYRNDLQKPYIELWLAFIGFDKVEKVIADRTLFEPEESEKRASDVAQKLANSHSL